MTIAKNEQERFYDTTQRGTNEVQNSNSNRQAKWNEIADS